MSPMCHPQQSLPSPHHGPRQPIAGSPQDYLCCSILHTSNPSTLLGHNYVSLCMWNLRAYMVTYVYSMHVARH